MKMLFALLAAGCCGLAAMGATCAEYHVNAERGDDAAAGTAAAPFRTPARARDAVRQLKGRGAFPKDGVVVVLHGRFSTTAAPILDLTDADSGVSAAAPVVWRAGADGALLTGSMPLPEAAFGPVADAEDVRLRPEVRKRVRVCDLAALGVGELAALPKCFRRWEAEELFCGGRALPLAGYPNRGWMTVGKVLDRGVAPVDPSRGEFLHGVRGGKFVSDDPAVGRWTKATDAVLFGFWCWDWHGDYLRIASIDPTNRVVTLAAPSLYGVGHAEEWQKSRIRFRAHNLPEELDVPGEWYLDRSSRRLYCLPPEEGLGDAELALAKAPLVRGRNLRHVRFEGLKFRYAVGCAVELGDSVSVTLDSLDARWLTTDGVRLRNARECAVRRCRIAHVGTTALSVSGGDRRTLAKSGNVIADNDLGHAGRLARIDGKCLSFGGCGIVVEHNYIHDTPYICIAYGGNEHLFQYNVVECAMLEAGDGAGVYTGRDWGSRGNVLRWNYFNSFGQDGVRLRKSQGRPCDCEALKDNIMVEGVYLDDCDSGEEIYGNVFHKAGRAMFTGGGRDNRWHHNLVIGCRSAVFLDTRGLLRARPGTKVADGWDLLAKVEQFNYREEPWRSRYPSLATTMENDPLLPIGTAYFENVAIGCETFYNCQGLAYGLLRATLENRGNVTVGQKDCKRDLEDYPQRDPSSRAKLLFRDDPDLVAAAAADPLNVQDTPAFRAAFPSFPRIPVEKLGRRTTEATAGSWRAYEGNPVLGNEKLGTCFDVNVVTDGPAPYTMYFSWRPKKAIALVRSNDALTWTQEPEICLQADKSCGWEDDLNRSCTVKKDGVWHMWYTGQAKDAKRGWMSRIGYATSRDGVHFTRVRRTPVMVPEFPFEKESVMNPYVRWDAKRQLWRMWYAAGETYEPNVLCYAESKDGLDWKKWAKNPMFGGAGGIAWDRDRVGACEVYPLPDGRWVMFYIGYSDIDTARIGCAFSDDGVTNWRRHPQNPIVAPDLCTWNSSACYKPSAIRDERNNRWLLWYNGRNGAPEYVGMAIHEGLDLEAPNVGADGMNTADLLKTYVRRFNSKDVELYTNAIPNSAAEAFMQANCPRFACPDRDIERTYYFRWWTFRKHLRRDLGSWTVSEFLPDVSWAGAGNTIVCAAGHHLREGRWLRDPKYVSDYARFWLTDKRATHRWGYSSWLFTGVCGLAEVTGDEKLPVDLLDAAVAYYRRWEQGFEHGAWPHAKTAHMGGDGKGGFVSIDNYEGSEVSLGANGYKPLLASAMWSEATHIAEVAKKAGRADLAAEFEAKAETNRKSILKNCWNEKIGFFTTKNLEPRTSNPEPFPVRELSGYAPWYFGMPTDGRKADWSQLTDPQGFAARYGLTFPERRAKGFELSYEGHECKWNGPSWPFATSLALTALANDLHASPSSSPSPLTFTSLLWQYADAQRRTHPKAWEEKGGDWEVVPWIDENLNPDTGDWISRTVLKKRGDKRQPVERGKDYNHSTFCDLVISGLVGFVPNGAKGFTVDPLAPATWDYFTLEKLRYRGHDVAVRWQRGKGLSVELDGKPVACRDTLGRLTVQF